MTSLASHQLHVIFRHLKGKCSAGLECHMGPFSKIQSRKEIKTSCQFTYRRFLQGILAGVNILRNSGARYSKGPLLQVDFPIAIWWLNWRMAFWTLTTRLSKLMSGRKKLKDYLSLPHWVRSHNIWNNYKCQRVFVSLFLGKQGQWHRKRHGKGLPWGQYGHLHPRQANNTEVSVAL